VLTSLRVYKTLFTHNVGYAHRPVGNTIKLNTLVAWSKF